MALTIMNTLKSFFTKTNILLVCSGLSLTVSAYAKVSDGDPDRLFQYGSSARDVALGRAVVASAHGPAATYWNPALISNTGYQEVQFFHADLVEGFQYNYMGYAHPLRSASGFGAYVFQYGSGSAERKDQNNQNTGAFNDSRLGVAIGAGTKGLLFPQLGLGATVKALRRDVGGRSSSLYGLDVGLSQAFMNGKLMSGLQLVDPVSFSSGETSDKLPFRTNLGFSYNIISSFILGLQIDNKGEFSLGSEYSFGNLFSLQLGQNKNGAISFGTGLHFKNAVFNFAVNQNTSGLGSAYLGSMNYKFGVDRNRIREEMGSVGVPKAILMVRNGDWLRAKLLLERSIALDPTNEEASLLLQRLKSALTALQVKRPQQEKKWKENPTASWIHGAVSSFIDKDYRSAQLQVAYASMKQPESLPIKNLLSAFESASSVADQIPQKQKDMTPEAFISFKRGQVADAFAKKEYGKAIQENREIVLLEPANAEDWQRLGSLYFAIEEKQKALEAYETTLRLNPNNAPLKKFVKEKFKVK